MDKIVVVLMLLAALSALVGIVDHNLYAALLGVALALCGKMASLEDMKEG